MVELQPIFKRAYWSLAAGGLLYVLFVFAMTFPEIQRLYVLSDLEQFNLPILIVYSVLYAHKVNPSLWEDVNQVEKFGFLSTMRGTAMECSN